MPLPPKRRTKRLSVVIPNTVCSQIADKKLYYRALGEVARTLGIFRVDELILYMEKSNDENFKIQKRVEDYLEYLLTPQYLRKDLYPISDEYKYFGVAPPLTLPSHPKVEDYPRVKFREGIVKKKVKNGVLVYVGLGKPVLVRSRSISVGDVVLVRILKERKGHYLGKVVKNSKMRIYWKFKVESFKGTLEDLLKSLRERDKGHNCLFIGTSKYGKRIDKEFEKLREIVERYEKLYVFFGAPKRGLFDLLKKEYIAMFDTILNFVPYQGVRVIHTEEALPIVLSTMNILVNRDKTEV
ncbi:MAG: putative RNA uridine N3 methyltransferase [Candidatus Asgardarchaeia archaeon]